VHASESPQNSPEGVAIGACSGPLSARSTVYLGLRAASRPRVDPELRCSLSVLRDSADRRFFSENNIVQTNGSPANRWPRVVFTIRR